MKYQMTDVDGKKKGRTYTAETDKHGTEYLFCRTFDRNSERVLAQRTIATIEAIAQQISPVGYDYKRDEINPDGSAHYQLLINGEGNRPIYEHIDGTLTGAIFRGYRQEMGIENFYQPVVHKFILHRNPNDDRCDAYEINLNFFRDEIIVAISVAPFAPTMKRVARTIRLKRDRNRA